MPIKVKQLKSRETKELSPNDTGSWFQAKNSFVPQLFTEHLLCQVEAICTIRETNVTHIRNLRLGIYRIGTFAKCFQDKSFSGDIRQYTHI